MSNPSLVIGVGGTGQWAVAYIKKILKDTYGRVPANVKLLVYDTDVSTARVGGTGIPDQHTPPGEIEDVVGELQQLGGNAHPLATAIADDRQSAVRNPAHAYRYPCLSKWFPAEDYTLDPTAAVLLALNHGAGQYRQLGRLTLFKDMAAGPAGSRVYISLSTAINTIQALALANPPQVVGAGGAIPAPGIDVYLIGSLAGGTGAGLFIDIAHIVKKLAEQNPGCPANTSGYFILPKGFSGVYDHLIPADKLAWQGRAFAAMRENDRFSAAYKVNVGYPICYLPLPADPVFNGTVEGALFGLIYYFDGQRTHNPLTGVETKEGLCPMIAELVATGIDPAAGAWLYSHKANVDATAAAMAFDKYNKTQIGTMGSYSWVIPMNSLVSEWSLKLSKQVTEDLFPGPEDPTTHAKISLAGYADHGEEAANNWFREYTTHFFGKWGYEDKTAPTTQDNMNSWPLEEWLKRLKNLENLPNQTPQEQAVVARLANAQMSIETEMAKFLFPYSKGWGRNKRFAEVIPTSEIPNEKRHYGLDGTNQNPAANRVREDADKAHNIIEKELQASFQNQADWQKGAYTALLEDYCNRVMNGVDKNKALGKLIQFVESLIKHFETRIDQIDQSIGKYQSDKAYRTHVTNRDNALTEMKTSIRAQKTYLEEYQDILDVDRFTWTQEANKELLYALKEHTNFLLESLQSWRDVLATGANSVCARINNGMLAQGEHLAAEMLISHVRKVIRDDAYEAARYQYYANGKTATIESELDWTFTNGAIGVTLGGVTLYLDGRRNQEELEKRCRRAFEPAFMQESIADYLVNWYQKDPATGMQPQIQQMGSDIANDLWQMAEPPLELNLGVNPVNYNNLQIFQNPAVANLTPLLTAVQAQLGANSGVQHDANGNVITNTDKLLQATDRFRMVYIHFNEVIENQQTKAYTEGKAAYMQVPPIVRKRAQTFPAEIHAFDYETHLGYPLHHRSVRLLEDLKLFNLSVDAYIYGKINSSRLLYPKTYTDANGVLVTEWWLTLQAVPGEFDAAGSPVTASHHVLTNDTESLFVAFERFILTGCSVGYGVGDVVPNPLPTGWKQTGKQLPFPPASDALTHDIALAKQAEFDVANANGGIENLVPRFTPCFARLSNSIRETALKQTVEFSIIQLRIGELTNKINQIQEPQERDFYQLIKAHLEIKARVITESMLRIGGL